MYISAQVDTLFLIWPTTCWKYCNFNIDFMAVRMYTFARNRTLSHMRTHIPRLSSPSGLFYWSFKGGGPEASPTLCCFVVHSTRRFVLVLALCYFVLMFFCHFSIVITSLEKEREPILVFFVRLLDLRLFGFVCFLFLFVYWKGCGLLFWNSLSFSVIFSASRL